MPSLGEPSPLLGWEYTPTTRGTGVFAGPVAPHIHVTSISQTSNRVSGNVANTGAGSAAVAAQGAAGWQKVTLADTTITTNKVVRAWLVYCGGAANPPAKAQHVGARPPGTGTCDVDLYFDAAIGAADFELQYQVLATGA